MSAPKKCDQMHRCPWVRDGHCTLLDDAVKLVSAALGTEEIRVVWLALLGLASEQQPAYDCPGEHLSIKALREAAKRATWLRERPDLYWNTDRHFLAYVQDGRRCHWALGNLPEEVTA